MTKVNERGELKKASKEEVESILNADVKDQIAQYVEREEKAADHIVQTLGLKGGTLLDVGCGQGCLDIALALKCPDLEFVLVDPSEVALQAVSQNFASYGLAERLKVVKGDEQDLPFEDESFEYAISATPGLWPNKQQGLEEMHRVLAVGGRAYVTQIEWDNYRDYFGMMMQAELAKFSVNKDGKNVWVDIFKLAGDNEESED